MNRKSPNRPFAADYTYTVEVNIIAIIDLDLGNRSVTNDIDYVLAEIRAEVDDLSGYSVIYQDSMERWDGVRLVNHTVHFYGLGEVDKQSAISRLFHLLDK